MINTARQVGTVLGTAAITMINQPVADLIAVRHGWEFLIGAGGAAVLASAVLATFQKRGATSPHVADACL